MSTEDNKAVVRRWVNEVINPERSKWLAGPAHPGTSTIC